MDNKGLEDLRQKRIKEQQDRIAKQHLQTDLASKKNFLFSTKTTIDMKSAVMKGKEIKIRTLEAEIHSLELKEKIILQKEQAEEQVKHRLDAEEVQKKAALQIAVQTKRANETEAQKIDREMAAVTAEIQKVTREIDAKKMQLAGFEKEADALKKKKVVLVGQHGVDQFGKKLELTAIHTNAERKARDIAAEKAEAEHIKLQKEIKKRDLATAEKERDQLKYEIDQLAKDKVKLEAEVRALEVSSR